MALTNNAEGGVSGATPTTTDGGSGDNWTTVTTSGDAVLQYANTPTLAGSMAYKLGTRTSLANHLAWTNPTVMDETSGSFLFLVDVADITAAVYIMQLRQTLTGFIAMYITFGSTEKVLIRYGTDTTSAFTSSGSIAANTVYRIDWFYRAPADAGTIGQARLLWSDAASVLIEDSGWVNVTATGSLSSVSYVRYGMANAIANSPSATGFVYLDSISAFENTGYGHPIRGPVIPQFVLLRKNDPNRRGP